MSPECRSTLPSRGGSNRLSALSQRERKREREKERKRERERINHKAEYDFSLGRGLTKAHL